MFRSQLRLGLRGITVIVTLMLTGGSALAEVDPRNSANHDISGCRAFLTEGTHDDLFGAGWCAGTVFTLKYMGRGNSCPPDAVTASQLVHVVVRYIDARPERMHESFKELALEALKTAWPCKR